MSRIIGFRAQLPGVRYGESGGGGGVWRERGRAGVAVSFVGGLWYVGFVWRGLGLVQRSSLRMSVPFASYILWSHLNSQRLNTQIEVSTKLSRPT